MADLATRYDRYRSRPGDQPLDLPSDGVDVDRLKIMDSKYFRRLGGVTQVLSDVTESTLLFNRLTHSLRVASVGNQIATRLLRHSPDLVDVLDPTAVEVAGLAHDLGHPPFGHIGEQVLDEVLLNHRLEGFEGNAQTFRIITKLAPP